MVAVMVVVMAVATVMAVVMAVVTVTAVVTVMAAVTVTVMVAVTVPSWRNLAVQAAAVLRVACHMAGRRLMPHKLLGGISWSSLAPQTDAR